MKNAYKSPELELLVPDAIDVIEVSIGDVDVSVDGDFFS